MADSNSLLTSPHSDSGLKRKREMETDLDNGRVTRPSHGPNGNGMQAYDHSLNTNDFSQIDQQVLEHVGQQNGVGVHNVNVHDDNALAAKAALAAQQQQQQTPQNKYPPPDGSYDPSQLTQQLQFPDDVGQTQLGGMQHPNSTAAAVYAAREAQSMGSASKPPVGSPEWHTLRKNNHKEVERRRRETINEGINEIAKIVPNCEKNKGSILSKAVQYIQELDRERKALRADWEREKITIETALAEITMSNTKLKVEVNRRGQVARKWIERCREGGLVGLGAGAGVVEGEAGFEDAEVDEASLGDLQVVDQEGL